MRLLLLLAVLGSGWLPGSPSGRALSPASLDLSLSWSSRGGGFPGNGDQLRNSLPEAPAVVLAGQGIQLPASTLREGLNHRSGLELDPDGTPSTPGAQAPLLHGRDEEPRGEAHRFPCPAVPLFSSAIPPPHRA